MHDPRIEWLTGKRVPLAIFALALLLFTWKLGSNDLWAPDEPYFAEGAREMLVDGQWLVPHINGVVDNHKPPFFFWSIAWFGALFGGITPLIARVPSVLAAFGTLWLTMRLGSRYDVAIGRLAAALLLTMHLFWEKARWAQSDALLCFFIVCALSIFHHLYRQLETEPDTRLRFANFGTVALFWLAIALAFLTKGPIGLVVPLGVVFAVVACDRRPRVLLALRPLLGLLILIAVVGGWAYLATTRVEGYDALASVKEHFFERASQGMHHVQPFWYYGEVWTYTLLPWSFLFPGMLFFGWRRRHDPETRFALIWVVFVWLLFSASTEKRDLYILPSLPAIALLMATWLVGACRKPEGLPLRSIWITAGFRIVAVSIAIAGVAAPFLAADHAPDSVTRVAALGLLLMLAGGAIWWSTHRPLATSLATTGLVGSAMFLTMVTFVYPGMEPNKSARPLAAAIEHEMDGIPRSERAIVGLDLSNVTRGINFHTQGRYLDFVPTGRAAIELLELPSYHLLVANEHLLRETLTLAEWQALDVAFQSRINRRDIVVVRSRNVTESSSAEAPES